MLGLAESLPEEYRSTFISFSESGLCRSFVDRVRQAGFECVALAHDTPRLFSALRELVRTLRRHDTDVLCCHGYKANLLGLFAARWLGIPAIAVSRGWTGETFRIRIYEVIDRRVIRSMNRIVCVSAAQARKVQSAGVRSDRIEVIHNAIGRQRFATPEPDPEARNVLLGMFAQRPSIVIGAAGRLSPEKGFDVLVEAAGRLLKPVCEMAPGANGQLIGFVLFGDGQLRDALAQKIAALGIGGRFVLAGFRADFDRFMPHFDLFVQSSLTEGLPNVILEAQAAGVPVVATAVGGTPEIIDDCCTGWLVAAGDAGKLAGKIQSALADPEARRRCSRAAIENVRDRFSFASQAEAYARLWDSLVRPAAHVLTTLDVDSTQT
jgi:glycosyltransferase involved in cell wall biosynthesis